MAELNARVPLPRLMETPEVAAARDSNLIRHQPVQLADL
jgi:hypothetical protein